jgi:hypothetical protein
VIDAERSISEYTDGVLFEAIDFLHWDHGLPESTCKLAEPEDLSSETRRNIRHQNRERLYQRVAVAVPA